MAFLPNCTVIPFNKYGTGFLYCIHELFHFGFYFRFRNDARKHWCKVSFCTKIVESIILISKTPVLFCCQHLRICIFQFCVVKSGFVAMRKLEIVRFTPFIYKDSYLSLYTYLHSLNVFSLDTSNAMFFCWYFCYMRACACAWTAVSADAYIQRYALCLSYELCKGFSFLNKK